MVASRPPCFQAARRGAKPRSNASFATPFGSGYLDAGGEPYVVDFPVHIGTPAPVGPIAILVIVALLALLAVAVVQRRRAATGKLRAARDAARGQ